MTAHLAAMRGAAPCERPCERLARRPVMPPSPFPAGAVRWDLRDTEIPRTDRGRSAEPVRSADRVRACNHVRFCFLQYVAVDLGCLCCL
jgi:hypothetical protein